MPRLSKSAHAMEKISRHALHPQSEKVSNLRAGDQNGDAVGESDDDRTREILDRRAHASDSEEHQQHARHHRAGEQSFDAIFGDDSRDHHDERTGRAADLCFGTSERGDQEAGDDRAVDARLRTDPRSNRESHS